MSFRSTDRRGHQQSSAKYNQPVLREGSRGPEVLELQQKLAALRFDPGYIDGIFGPRTQEAVMAFQRVNGLSADGIVGPQTWAMLDAMTADLSAAIGSEAAWGLDHEVEIHYAQIRPIDGLTSPHKLPLSTDCSGFVTLCYKWAGAPDPNGRDYDGYGYTGTLFQHMKQIDLVRARTGDLVLWADKEKPRHVALVIEPGIDPLLVSHGSEPGPRQIHFSSEHQYFERKFGPSVRACWLTLPGADTHKFHFPRLLRKKALAPLFESDPPMEETLDQA